VKYILEDDYCSSKSHIPTLSLLTEPHISSFPILLVFCKYVTTAKITVPFEWLSYEKCYHFIYGCSQPQLETAVQEVKADFVY
jgi:hypothetical protein